MTTDSTSREVRVDKTIAAPPAAVFEFFTSSARWSAWQGRKTTIDPRVGGSYEMQAPNGGVARGTVLEWKPPDRIVFSWGWEGHPTLPPGSSTVTIELAPRPGGTLLTLRHTGLPEEETGLHRLGWEHYVGRLARAAAGDDPGDDAGLDASA